MAIELEVERRQRELGEGSHRTAIARQSPSLPARVLLASIKEMVAELGGGEDKSRRERVGDVLDFGSGRGRDVEFYREQGLDAEGFDAHPGFGSSRIPERKFRVGTAVFVLNVIPSKEARIEALKGLAALLVAGGYGVLVARSPGVIGREARNRGWKAWGDGFISNQQKNTFQKGLSVAEMAQLSDAAGLQATVMVGRAALVADATVLIVRKPSR